VAEDRPDLGVGERLLPSKYAPSQVAQYEIPRPLKRSSPGTPSGRGFAPVATITARASIVSSSSSSSVFGAAARSWRVISTARRISAPKRPACAAKAAARSAPFTSSGNPG